MSKPNIIWRVFISVPAGVRLDIEDMLQASCMVVSSFESADCVTWSVEGLTIIKPDRLALEATLSNVLRARKCHQDIPLEIDLLPERDWLIYNQASFPPFRIGRYFILGSHVGAQTPTGSVRLHLDSGAAFGSGEHATTAGCLRILDDLAKVRRFRRPLDMGCGSGVLAIAMAKTWRRKVIASDIDPDAIRVTEWNARKNRIAPLILSVRGDGFRPRFVNREGHFDLIVANILARPLISMAADIERHLRGTDAGGGAVILSGFLVRDIRWVIAAFKARRLILQRIFILDGWATLLLTR